MLKKAAIFGLAGVMAVAAGCGGHKNGGNANNKEEENRVFKKTKGGGGRVWRIFQNVVKIGCV